MLFVKNGCAMLLAKSFKTPAELLHFRFEMSDHHTKCCFISGMAAEKGQGSQFVPGPQIPRCFRPSNAARSVGPHYLKQQYLFIINL